MNAPTSRLDEIKARAAASDCRCVDPACPHGDLAWAVEEINHLRAYIAVLGDLAYALDTMRWALENPAPGRVERCRLASEEAREKLLATPIWRAGECHGGCRRYATHEFVVEEDGSVEREPCCWECGSLWRAVKRSSLGEDEAPPRLEPIPRSNAEAKEVLQ